MFYEVGFVGVDGWVDGLGVGCAVVLSVALVSG